MPHDPIWNDGPQTPAALCDVMAEKLQVVIETNQDIR
jgi:hypothetical protein